MSFWVWAPTRAAQATLRDLQKRTNLSSLAMGGYLSVLKLQTWLLGFRRTATPPSEDAFIPVCRGSVALPHTALHPGSTNHREKQDVNYTNCAAQFKKGICHTGILVASYIFLLPLSPLSAHRLPCLQPPFQQHFPLLSLFTNFQPPFLPVKEAAPMGAAAAIAHNSPKECQSEVICRHQVDYYFLREWKRKRGAQA